MSVVTVTTVTLGGPVDDAALRVYPYQANVLRGVVVRAGEAQVIFMGEHGQARAIQVLRRLADELESLT